MSSWGTQGKVTQGKYLVKTLKIFCFMLACLLEEPKVKLLAYYWGCKKSLSIFSLWGIFMETYICIFKSTCSIIQSMSLYNIAYVSCIFLVVCILKVVNMLLDAKFSSISSVTVSTYVTEERHWTVRILLNCRFR